MNYTEKILAEFNELMDKLWDKYGESYEVYNPKEFTREIESFLFTLITQALAEERERVVGILSVENHKLEEWYSSSERPGTLTHFEANQRNMKTRNEIEQLISFPLDNPKYSEKAEDINP